MGCINSKHVSNSSISPLHDPSLTLFFDSSLLHDTDHGINYGWVEKILAETEDNDKISNHKDSASKRSNLVVDNRDLEYLNYSSNNKHSNKPAYTSSSRYGRSTVAEHIAAGWPAWLSAVAGEAIDGWVPQKSENYERLEKIGQGTYSSVYRARDLRTGKIMALKKVRFDNFQPESVRFMAREITILRRLDHPNVMKLEGIITSRLSCSVYLVFEYMEHDLAGLISSPNVRFTEAQIKCYMKQLLRGIDHCHSRGVLHRDIKSSNILVNNEGQLKIADFGLANFVASRQPLTSRVVTMWYRPPELFLGSTDYGTYVDMWSIGCVFAELFIGKPILKGRTEVEQLHKIFMLCGNPPEEYWKKTTLPQATMLKPRHDYRSSLRERCKELPKSAVNLIESLLSVEPEKRASATSALQSEYFHVKPYACDPTSLPMYSPSKELDAKFREEALKKKSGGKLRASGSSRNMKKGRKTFQEQTTFYKVGSAEVRRNAYYNGSRSENLGASKASYDTVSDVSQTTDLSQTDTVCSLPAQSSVSNGSLRWSTKRRKHVSFVTPTSQDIRPIESIHEEYETQDLSSGHRKEETLHYTGPMLIQSHRTNGRQESYTRTDVRRSRFSRDAEL